MGAEYFSTSDAITLLTFAYRSASRENKPIVDWLESKVASFGATLDSLNGGKIAGTSHAGHSTSFAHSAGAASPSDIYTKLWQWCQDAADRDGLDSTTPENNQAIYLVVRNLLREPVQIETSFTSHIP